MNIITSDEVMRCLLKHFPEEFLSFDPAFLKRIYYKGQLIDELSAIRSMSDQEWEQRKQEEEYIKKNYQQPKVIFDPFEVFQPSKSFIQSVIKQLRNEAYGLIEDQQCLPEWADRLKADLDARHRKLVSRIRGYVYRLNNFKKTGRWDQVSQEGRINDQDINKAKLAPITEFFTDRLKAAGPKRLIGLCPFHSESTPSFVIYTEQNSFNCYGCNVNGSVIDFIMLQRKMSFIETIKFLIK